MRSYLQASRPLSLVTALGPDTLLLERFSGREAISTLFRFQLEMLADGKTSIPFAKLLGQPMLVKLQHGPEQVRYFGGICSQLRQGAALRGPDGGQLIRYHAELVPQLWLCTRRVQSRIFQQQSVIDILGVVLAGLNMEFRLRAAYPQRNYCVQFRESDFAFVSRLMEEEGIYYYFEHSDKGHQLVVTDLPLSHPALKKPFDVLSYAGAAGHGSGVAVLNWEKEQHLAAARYVVRDRHFEVPHKALEASAVMPDSVRVGNVDHPLNLGAFGGLEVYEHPEDYAQRFDSVGPGGEERPERLAAVFQDNKAAQLLMEREAIHSLRIEGNSDCVGLAAGYVFTLEGHPQGKGDFLLLEVEHQVYLPGFRSGRDEPVSYENRFVCWPKEARYRPPARTPSPRIHGSHTATVTGPSPGEIYTDKYGRIKVRFHWDRKPADDLSTSCWIRVMQPWAGQGWGALHLPRVGQEVVVDFLDGNPDRPIVLGSVYNGEQLPPYELPAQRMVSGLRSRSLLSDSSQDCNELRFDDTQGAEELSVTAQRDMTTTVEHDFNQTVAHDAGVTVHNNTTWDLGNGPLTTNFVATWNNIEINKLTKTVVSSVSHADATAMRANVCGLQFTGVAGLNAEIDMVKYEKVLTKSFESCGAKTLTTTGDCKSLAGHDHVVTAKRDCYLAANRSFIAVADADLHMRAASVFVRAIPPDPRGTATLILLADVLTLQSNKEIRQSAGPVSILLDSNGTIHLGNQGNTLALTNAGVTIHGDNVAISATTQIKLSAPTVMIDAAPAPAPMPPPQTVAPPPAPEEPLLDDDDEEPLMGKSLLR